MERWKHHQNKKHFLLKKHILLKKHSSIKETMASSRKKSKGVQTKRYNYIKMEEARGIK